MRAKVAAYTVLFGIGIAAMVVYLAVVEGKTFETWELVLTFLVLPLGGIAIWFRHDWAPAKVREVVEKAERDWNQP